MAQNQSVKQTNERTVANEETKDHPFGIPDSDYQELLKLSLMDKGNNARLKKVIEKMRAGDNVYIAALGGSVTEGAGPADFKDGYAYQFFEALKKNYSPDGKNLYFDNAGLSGTPSQLGLIRYQTDVVDVIGRNPDLLIVEFAVNDDGQPGSTKAFEAIIRNALRADEHTAVIALYSAAKYRNSAQAKNPVAQFYGVPQVNVLTAVDAAIRKAAFTEEQYYTDTVHPTKEGHTLQTDCLLHLFKTADASPADIPATVPESWCMQKALSNFTRISGDDENVTISAGSFAKTDSATQILKKNNKANFPQNWMHAPDAAEPGNFVMKIQCKALLFAYKEQASWRPEKFGTADVYVDGKLYASYDGAKEGGWGNGVPVYLIDEAECAAHTVEVRMAPGDEDKYFTIVAMGYSR